MGGDVMDTILQFTVTNQQIKRTDKFVIVEGSENYLKAQFTFETPDWDGLFKTGIFIDADGTVHPSLCTNDICDVPPAWLKAQRGAVAVLGSDGVTKVPSDPVTVRVYTKGYTDETIEEESDSYFNQIMAAFRESKEFVTSEANRAEQANQSAADYASKTAEMLSSTKESESSANTSKENAEEAEQAAKESASQASASAQSAADSETNAKDSATEASEYAASAKNDADKTAADRVQTGKDATSTAKDRTQTGEDRAATKADREVVHTLASNAYDSATAAEGFSNAAKESASQASASAQSALDSETNAKTSEANASTSETNAATSEANAKEYSETTETAKNDAVSAKDDAVAAKEDAESARTDIQESIDGVAQEATAEEIADLLNKANSYLEQVVALNEELLEVAGKAGSLNGFSLHLNEDDSVAISYTDPDTEELMDLCTLPTATTTEAIYSALVSIGESLTILAGKDDTNES
jgi:hypothetical protein